MKNIIGGNTAYDPSTGVYTNADIGGTGKGNINDAIKAAKTEVAAGTNVAGVAKTEGSDGQNIYTVNAKGTTASAGSTAVTVSSANKGSNVTDYAIDLSQATKDSLVKADNAVQYDDAGKTSVTLGGAGSSTAGEINQPGRWQCGRRQQRCGDGQPIVCSTRQFGQGHLRPDRPRRH